MKVLNVNVNLTSDWFWLFWTTPTTHHFFYLVNLKYHAYNSKIIFPRSCYKTRYSLHWQPQLQMLDWRKSSDKIYLRARFIRRGRECQVSSVIMSDRRDILLLTNLTLLILLTKLESITDIFWYSWLLSLEKLKCITSMQFLHDL